MVSARKNRGGLIEKMHIAEGELFHALHLVYLFIPHLSGWVQIPFASPVVLCSVCMNMWVPHLNGKGQ